LPEEKTISLHELSELVAYEELEQDSQAIQGIGNNPFRRSVRAMHHYVPLNPFKATVRVHRTGVPESIIDEHCSDSSVIVSNLGADSPASFPPTPFSRAFVMNRASERVASLMFAARDRLRVEALSVSRDEYSRMVATEARTSGQYAVFDPRQSSSGIALTCGNHCAVKTGKGLCCSCRSMVPIHPNTYVYLEFSITVFSGQTPTLGIGLTTPDCPLNVMVGSWPRSVGIYYDGQVLIGSQWFQQSADSARKIEAGSTIGMLIYVPRVTANVLPVSSTEVSDPEISQPLQTAPDTVTENSEVAADAPQTVSPLAVVVKYNINGEPINFTTSISPLLQDMVGTDLYPTVSLFSEETRVWCRFCEADIVYRHRENIQAPLGCRVYCLDGSLLLDESL
jgi:hypothetical protein